MRESVSQEWFSERFEREAQAISSLNHPNICTLHDVGPNCLVMELVEGPTLADRIAARATGYRESATDRAPETAPSLRGTGPYALSSRWGSPPKGGTQ